MVFSFLLRPRLMNNKVTMTLPYNSCIHTWHRIHTHITCLGRTYTCDVSHYSYIFMLFILFMLCPSSQCLHPVLHGVLGSAQSIVRICISMFIWWLGTMLGDSGWIIMLCIRWNRWSPPVVGKATWFVFFSWVSMSVIPRTLAARSRHSHKIV